MQQGLNEAWAGVTAFLPKLAGFLVILFIGDVVAMLVAWTLVRVLQRIGFDAWAERGVLRRVLDVVGADASDVLSFVTFWAVFLLALQLGLGVFGPNPISDVLEGLIAYLPDVFVAIVIMVIATAVADAVSDVLRAMLGPAPDGPLIARLAGLAIVVFGVFAALDQLRIAPAIVIALYYAVLAVVAGVFIVAVGAGGMRTMHGYWERASNVIDARATDIEPAVAAQDAPQEVVAEEPPIPMPIPIDDASDWKPPRARGYELGAPST